MLKKIPLPNLNRKWLRRSRLVKLDRFKKWITYAIYKVVYRQRDRELFSPSIETRKLKFI